MTTLPNRTFRVLREVARALFDGGRGVPEHRLDWLIADLRDMFRFVGPLTRVALRLGATAIQLLPVVLIGRPRRFTGLSRADRIRFLDRLEHSALAMLFVAVKMFLCMVWFEHPDAAREIGYDGKALLLRPLGSPAVDDALGQEGETRRSRPLGSPAVDVSPGHDGETRLSRPLAPPSVDDAEVPR